jgi:penicillin-binding protein 1B
MRQSSVVPKREMKVRIPARAGLARFFLAPLGRILILASALLVVAGVAIFCYSYEKYTSLVDQKLRGPFAQTAKIFAAPEAVAVGDVSSPDDIAADLRRSGYTESHSNPQGYFQRHPGSLDIFPGTESYFDQEAATIKFANGHISEIVSLQDNTTRPEYQLEPQLITNVAGPSREKRRTVKFRDIPPVLVQAITSAEDKHFFQHPGFDAGRVIKAAYVDLKQGRKDQGASTLTMQLARMILGEYEKSVARKWAEIIVTIQLEQRLSKEEIFAYYSNDYHLGAHGSFQIYGFGEAAEAYFGKDLSQISLPEAAALAGMIQRPSAFDPYRHPDRLKDRRNVVLGLMRANGYISDRDYALACDAPMAVARGAAQSTEAPYYVDLVGEELQNKFQDADFQSNAARIYTTLDMRLQRAAAEVIRTGMQNVDEQIRKQRRFRGKTPPEPQVALIAIDPHTGAVRALAGGRNYGASQLDHILAKRQPGSIFKPFVYATAMDTAIEGGPRILTPSTIVNGDPRTFYYENGTREYSPKNFKNEKWGDITIRTALAHSVNSAAVEVAQMVGYANVVAMAKRAGMNDKIEATPAVALGSYDITPLEAAGAYTVFANGGDYVKPNFVSLVRAQNGQTIYKNAIEKKPVLDPRVAYVMTNMMEEVLRSGTAAGIRAKYKFDAPAAGKTGTSDRDGWFAGYTSELLCIVWVGFDDSRDLDIEGAHSAAPIWAEFMKRALDFREYRDTKAFRAPDGIVTIDIDPLSGMPATPQCPSVRAEVYIAGTQPVGLCPLHGGRQGITNITAWSTEPSPSVQPQPAPSPKSNSPQLDSDAVARRAARQAPPDAQGAKPSDVKQAKQPDKPPKKGLLHRILGVFK